MRILALRGQNLASLPAFDIDLTSQAFKSTGLFAIVGETGAGKSTLLDALCLALYGDFPRVAGGGKGRVPDPGKKDGISTQNPAAILRRGAGAGFAEIDFEGRDRLVYRARWSVRRARGKADGNLLDAERTLERLDTGISLANKPTAVTAEVERLTGLTFEQFRRTVLLAQGEFDAFLMADDTMRAELLEKITGTEIYKRISQRVFEEFTQRRNDLAKLEAVARSATDALLSEADRTETEQRLATTLDAQKQLSTRADALQASVALLDRREAVRAAVAAAETTAAAARAAQSAASTDIARLSAIERIAPLRSTFDRLSDARQRYADATRRTTEIGAIAEAARSASLDIETRTAAAAQALLVAERSITDAEPQWREARRLDAELASVAQQVGKHDAELKAAAAQRNALQGEQQNARKQTDALTHDIAAIDAMRAENPGHATVSDRIDDIVELVGRYDVEAKRSQSLANERDVARAKSERSDAARAEAAAQLAAMTGTAEAAAKSLEQRRAALDAGNLAQLETQLSRHAALAEVIRDAHRHATSRADAAGALALAEQRIDAAAQSKLRAQRASVETQKSLELAASARRDVGALVDLAAATASKHAVALRGLLSNGQPCPVCGSTDHPAARHPDGLGAFAEAVRAERQKLDSEIERLTAGLRDLARANAEADASGSAARQDADRAELADRAAGDALAALLPKAALQSQALGYAGVSTTGSADELQRLQAEIQLRRSDLAARVDALRALRDDVDRLSKAHFEAQRDLTLINDTLKKLDTEVRNHSDALKQFDGAHAAATLSLQDNAKTLAPSLAAARMTEADLTRDSATALKRLRQIVEAYRHSVTRRADLTAALQSAEVGNAKRVGQIESLDAAAATLGGEHAAAMSRFEALRTERHALIAGEPVAEHEARLRAAATSARSERDVLQRSFAARNSELAASQAALRLAEQSVASTTAEVTNLTAAFLAGLAPQALSEAAAMDLLSTDPTHIADLKTRMAILETSIRGAETALATRRADLTGIDRDLSEHAIPVDAPAQLIAVRTELAAAAQSRGAIEATLARDTEERARNSAQRAVIAEHEVRFKIWEAVNDAVGSSTGDKFRRVAQAVTLDQLTRLANEQLGSLKPRYQLQRSSGDLGLLVVDRDMGDEVRGARSLSGGERFLVSLALALALSGLEGRQSFVDTLFIDEGFGTLDAETLDMAIDVLETLQTQGRKVGVITHVAAIIERVAVQIRVESRGSGRSDVRIVAPGFA